MPRLTHTVKGEVGREAEKEGGMEGARAMLIWRLYFHP